MTTGLLDTNASGVYVIAATPFTDDGALDVASLDRLVDFYVGCGVTGITVLGIMGEAPKLRTRSRLRSHVKSYGGRSFPLWWVFRRLASRRWPRSPRM
jgi:hypothetical protein